MELELEFFYPFPEKNEKLNQEAVNSILESKVIRKNPDLSELVDDYFKNSLQTLDFFALLANCLEKVRRSQRSLRSAVLSAKEEEPHYRTRVELTRIELAEDPFAEEYYRAFRSVYDWHVAMRQKLMQKRKEKLDGKFTFVGIIYTRIYAAIKDLDRVCELVDRLEERISTVLRYVRLSLRDGEKEGAAVELGIDGIKRQMSAFKECVDDLAHLADWCGRDEEKARTDVLLEIIRHLQQN